MSSSTVSPAPHHPRLTALAFAALAVLCAAPLLLESTEVWFLPPYREVWQVVLGHGVVVVGMLLVVGVRAFLDRETEPRAFALHALFVALAATLTLVHWLYFHYQPVAGEWQQDLYLSLFHHDYEPPHQYRPLPYGFVRSLEWASHDYHFSCLAYRAFFTYWFVWAWYRLARTVHPPPRAVLTLAVLIPLYPLSIVYYLGQLTDPLSHALFVLAMLWVVEDRPLALAAALALGVGAKETAVILVPAYLAVAAVRGRRKLGRRAIVATGLGSVCVLAFLAVRLPLGWQPGATTLNGAGLMIGTNLGIGEPIALTSVSLWGNYLQPLLFVGVFAPFIVRNWRRSDRRLRALSLTLAPLLLLSNLCFGWLYESRNYVPLLPLLATLALPVNAPAPPAQCTSRSRAPSP